MSIDGWLERVSCFSHSLRQVFARSIQNSIRRLSHLFPHYNQYNYSTCVSAETDSVKLEICSRWNLHLLLFALFFVLLYGVYFLAMLFSNSSKLYNYIRHFFGYKKRIERNKKSTRHIYTRTSSNTWPLHTHI